MHTFRSRRAGAGTCHRGGGPVCRPVPPIDLPRGLQVLLQFGQAGKMLKHHRGPDAEVDEACDLRDAKGVQFRRDADTGLHAPNERRSIEVPLYSDGDNLRKRFFVGGLPRLQMAAETAQFR